MQNFIKRFMYLQDLEQAAGYGWKQRILFIERNASRIPREILYYLKDIT